MHVSRCCVLCENIANTPNGMTFISLRLYACTHCWWCCDSAEWNVTKETSIKRRTCTHSPSNSRAYASSVSEHKTRRNTTANRAPVCTSETILTNVPNPIYTMQSRIYSAGFEYSVHRSHRECDEKYYAAVRRLTVPFSCKRRWDSL